MTLGKDLNTGEMIAALIILKKPVLEGRLTVTVRQDRKGGRLFRASRVGDRETGVGMSRVRVHWSADLRRKDRQELLARAAQAAYEIAMNLTTAAAIQATEEARG